ncbi:hypothetical protein EI555_013047 [Monodon monoceros]|uniref:Chromo domain-containing protein n=1 Tax=Monodon monoceros TaxID=40151 RepID=A0A4U1EV26_MONMO|nr:hypothetical protein EI555_013047 [Monodon monoceros]
MTYRLPKQTFRGVPRILMTPRNIGSPRDGGGGEKGISFLGLQTPLSLASYSFLADTPNSAYWIQFVYSMITLFLVVIKFTCRCVFPFPHLPVLQLPPTWASWRALWGKQNKKKVEEVLEEEEEEQVVEKVLDCQVVKGQVEHLLKWKGSSDEDSTWEPVENLDRPGLIAEFLQSQKTAHETDKSEGGKCKADSDVQGKGEESKPKKKEESEKPRGFARGLEPEQIIGTTGSSGELMFLMKWENSDEADLVPAKEANVKCPQVVISFYEERLTWHSYPSEDDDKKR